MFLSTAKGQDSSHNAIQGKFRGSFGEVSVKSRAGTPRRIPWLVRLSSFFGAAAAGQRLDPLDLFARLFIECGVAEVDEAVQAGVRVILVVGRRVEGIAGWRYPLGVHSSSLGMW